MQDAIDEQRPRGLVFEADLDRVVVAILDGVGKQIKAIWAKRADSCAYGFAFRSLPISDLTRNDSRLKKPIV
jgi:hypothetical protein